MKTARKGVGEYTIKVTGKAAHSGLDFDKGESAIVEMAKQITAISKLVDLKRGLTLNVGLVSGGTRTNVIPAQATASLDVRVARMKDAAAIDRQLKSAQTLQSQMQAGNHGRRKPSADGTERWRRHAVQESLGDCESSLAGSWKKQPSAAARTETSPPAWESPRWMAWEGLEKAPTPLTSPS